jgi:tetratricopeptide (TPR) repeat protein
MKTPADGWDRDEREALAPVEAELAAIRARHAGDPPLDLLRAARADALPPDLQARVSERLEEDAWNRALVDGALDVEHPLDAADADRLLARITQSARQEPAQRRRWFSRPPVWAPMTAAAAIAIVAIVWPARRPAAPAAPTATPAAPAATPAPPPTIVARNEPPVLLPLDKPDVKLSVAALVWRGPSGDTSLVDALAPGLDAYRATDYVGAAEMLEQVGRRYPASIEAPFYRGVSLLFLNEPADAIAELKKAERMNDDAFAVDVAWYLGIAEQRTGDVAAARARFDALCRRTTSRTAAACDAVKKLDGAR